LKCPTQQKDGVTVPTCTTTTITLKPCALNVLKFPFFADTIERRDREWKQAQRQGEFLDNSSTQKTKRGPKLVLSPKVVTALRPLKDDHPRTKPLILYIEIIPGCTFVFILQLGEQRGASVGVLHDPKKIANGPMDLAISKK